MLPLLSPSLIRNWSRTHAWDSVVHAERQRFAIRELARRELAKQDFLTFTGLFTPDYEPNWIHYEIAAYLDAFLEACERNERPRLMIFLPPRHGKSQLVSRCFTPYILGRHPNWEVVLATYNQEFASLHGRDVRGILIDPLYNELFPDVQLAKDSNAVDFVRTTAKGSFSAVGIGSSLTGRGAKILLIDDPVKDRADADSETMREAAWNWYSSTARTRLAPGGGIIVLQTRWHEDDLSGKLLTRAKESKVADQWHVYSYPAIATENEPHRKKGEALDGNRWPLNELESLKGSMQARDWTALYQQNPVPDDGNFFKRDWIMPYLYKPTEVPDSVYCYGASDYAIGDKQTNDYTVLLPVAVDEKEDIYILPTFVYDRLDGYDIAEKQIDLMEEHEPLYWAIERGHISKTIGPHLKKRMLERRVYTTLWDAVPSKDKLARARSLQSRMQMGKIRLPDTPFVQETIIPQLLAFPAGKHDDFVDALAWICQMLEDIMPAPPPAGLPPDDSVVADSWEDIQRRTPPPFDRSRHRPKSLFSHIKKAKTKSP